MACLDKRKSILRRVIWLLMLFCLLPLFSALAGGNPKTKPKNEQQIIGKWLQPDGGYVLELS
jgi:hypothetical protein